MPDGPPHRGLNIGGYRFEWQPQRISNACDGCRQIVADGAFKGYYRRDTNVERRAVADQWLFCDPCARRRETGAVGRALIGGILCTVQVVSLAITEAGEELEVRITDAAAGFPGEGRSGQVSSHRIAPADFTPREK